MAMVPEDIKRRALAYAHARSIHVNLEKELGSGKDGSVFWTMTPSAIKIFTSLDPYERELACYQRLAERSIIDIGGHQVPQLLDFDGSLLVIEMTIVHRPFLLDFAGAYIDEPPDFPEEVIDQWHADKSEQFGARWPEVLSVVVSMRRRAGIYLLDIHQGNITFADDPSSEQHSD
ncbi:MAG TPA: hypothetical protein VG269_18385 [Tepidisphaeraceae bacterium]|jgi:hypothetical protein|nr:hypothetical protein [Tepidisphaeraceae bacterium]